MLTAGSGMGMRDPTGTRASQQQRKLKVHGMLLHELGGRPQEVRMRKVVLARQRGCETMGSGRNGIGIEFPCQAGNILGK